MNIKQTAKQTILIVDDHPSNLAVLFDSLEGVGYKVLVDTNGQSALNVIDKTHPDIILLDVMMPGLDGYEVCGLLKSNKATADIPIIFMTALTDAVDEVKGLDLGAVDYIAKPIKVETVLARIKTHLQIYHLQNKLRKQNAELDAFAHTVAHDLKNPLGLVSGYISYIIESFTEIEPDDLLKYLYNVQHFCKKGNDIIDELLLLASIRKQEVPLEPLDMGEIVAKAKEHLLILQKKYQAEIVLPEKWPTARGYAPWVEAVWVNYLSNAIKYGGSPPRLLLGATSQADDTIQFYVKDNGPGLDPEAQTKLFNEFSRLDQIGREGHGLGLSIVRRIVEKLGGQVGIQSQIGGGSTFYFTLPACKSIKLFDKTTHYVSAKKVKRNSDKYLLSI